MKPLVALFFSSAVGAGAADPSPAIDFNRQVRPILSDKCFACHGPDEKKRKAGLRLDRKEGLFDETNGPAAVYPGKLEESELYRRITTTNERKRMPPGGSGKSLTAGEVEVIRRWIEAGAPWQGHWAYVKPSRPEPPSVANAEWVKNPLDRFVLKKIESAGLRPSPEADPVTLVRRLSLDLTGLPPEPAEVDAYLADRGPAAYQKLVDRLLTSPHYGERLAIHWLDLVRYADTTGIHGDNHREVAPYRDYVIRAFNDNKPFHRFTIEQLAGDLLPEATLEERVGSGYNRMLMTSNEGGAQPKEYIAKYAADRVRNASVVWMGATLGCAECHDHKFDPFTTRDFYRFSAFFADLEERVPAEPGPPFPVPDPEQQAERARLRAAIAEVETEIETQAPALDAALADWEASNAGKFAYPVKLSPWHSIGPFAAASFQEAQAAAFEPEKEIDLRKAYRDGKLRWKERAKYEDGKVHELSGPNSATYLYRAVQAREAATLELSLGSDDGLKVWLNGEPVLERLVERAAAPDQEQLTVKLREGENRLLLKVTNASGAGGFYFRAGGSETPEEVVTILRKPAPERSAADREKLAAHYRTIAPQLAPSRARLAELKKQRDALERALPRTLVSRSSKPRTVRVLPRGNWLDETGEIAEPGVPAFLPAARAAEGRATRLDLARWFVSAENPLTARVFANRLWMLFFGAGLCRTPDNLGSQGAWPTHLELLDWLAVEFMESGWDVKHLVRLMVQSATYRQSSVVSGELREKDPYNELLARQGRFRLDAEMVRDNALAVSGLLSRKIGGPSVKPYQPAGYWSHLNFPVREYQADHGESLYRRGLYTYWCRTFLHPSLVAFDAPTREECTVSRPRSNTPLAALTLLNDPSYVEAARAFAERILADGGGAFGDRLRFAFRRALSREPEPEEAKVLEELYRKHLAEYSADRKAAEEIRGAGELPARKDLDAAEVAAWISVSRAILNLHETITRS